MKQFIFVVLLCLVCVGVNNRVLAKPGHGGAPTAINQCDLTKIDNLCSTSPGGTFQDVNLFTTVRQSGQAQYKSWGGIGSNSPVGANICGFDYPCGNYTPTASLVAASTATQNTGCVYVASPSAMPAPQVQCTPGCVDPSSPAVQAVTGQYFHDASVSMNLGAGACSHAEVYNNHFTVGKHLCRGGAAEPILNVAGAPWLYAGSNTVEFDSTCDPAANLWGSAAGVAAGLIQQSTFTGTLGASNGVVPAFLTVGTGTTGMMYEGQYIDWSGKTHNQTNNVQLSYFLGAPSSGNGFIGTGHIAAGPLLMIDSVDPSSPSSTPAGGDELFCAVAGTGACSNRATGWPIIRSQGGGWLLQGGIGTFSTPVAIVTSHTIECDNSACDSGVWLAQQNLSVGPVTMTTGPIGADIGFSNSGTTHCNTVGDGETFQWNAILEVVYIAGLKNDCPVHSTANLIWQRSRIGDYLSGASAPHNNSIIEQDDTGSGSSTDIYGNSINVISEFRQSGDFVWYDKYSGNGTITGLFTGFSEYSGNHPGGWKTNYTSMQFNAGATAIVNKTVNNGGDYTTAVSQSGIIYRELSQSSTAVANANVTTTNNGNGTGNLHINTLNSGSIAVGEGIQTTQASQITGINGSDWTITPYVAYSGVTLDLFGFTPQINVFDTSGASVDPSGISGAACWGYDGAGTLISSVTHSNNHNLTDNSDFTSGVCNNHG